MYQRKGLGLRLLLGSRVGVAYDVHFSNNIYINHILTFKDSDMCMMYGYLCYSLETLMSNTNHVLKLFDSQSFKIFFLFYSSAPALIVV